MIISPLNYTGTKRKLLNQLLPLFPQDAPIFYDLFCGGCTVGLNYPSKYLVLNDVCAPLIALLCGMRDSTTGAEFMQKVELVMAEFDIKPGNQAAYLSLRNAYNAGRRDAATFYAMITASYNSTIRFNDYDEYNASFGGTKAYLHPKRKELTIEFADELIARKPRIYNSSFDKVPVHPKGFVYCDPPYYITSVSYMAVWDTMREYMLYRALDELNDKGIKFGLSNVTHNKGKVNTILTEWMKQYTVHQLDMSYAVSYCGAKELTKNNKTIEVYVCNY